MPEPETLGVRPAGTTPAGRTVLLAGASSSFGVRLARAFADAGARVVAVARRDVPELGDLDGVVLERCDLTSPVEVAALVESVHTRVGAVDAVLPLVGGWRGGGGIAGQSEADFRALEPSLTTLRLTTTAFWDDLVASDAGRVAVISAAAVASPRAGSAGYVALKAAAEAWTAALAHGFSSSAPQGAALVLRVRSLADVEAEVVTALTGLWAEDATSLNGRVRTWDAGEWTT